MSLNNSLLPLNAYLQSTGVDSYKSTPVQPADDQQSADDKAGAEEDKVLQDAEKQGWPEDSPSKILHTVVDAASPFELPSLQRVVIIIIGILLIAAGIFSFKEARTVATKATELAAA